MHSYKHKYQICNHSNDDTICDSSDNINTDYDNNTIGSIDHNYHNDIVTMVEVQRYINHIHINADADLYTLQ